MLTRLELAATSQSNKTVSVDAWGSIKINLRTDTHGGTSVLIFKDEEIEIFHGNLHTRVTFKFLDLEVTMNSELGDWKNPTWAKEKILEALKKSLTFDMLMELVHGVHKNSFKAGREAFKQEVKNLFKEEF